MKAKARIGLVLTALYLIAFAVILLRDTARLLAMEPNEWGDLLAGGLAPLAFLWLILGYFQQGEELAQNTEALRLQTQEPERQVAETAALVEQSRVQAQGLQSTLEIERLRHEHEVRAATEQIQPVFRYDGATGKGGDTFQMKFFNEGGPAWKLTAQLESGGGEVGITPADFVAAGSQGRTSASNVPEHAVIVVSYHDQLQSPRQQRLFYEETGGSTRRWKGSSRARFADVYRRGRRQAASAAEGVSRSILRGDGCSRLLGDDSTLGPRSMMSVDGVIRLPNSPSPEAWSRVVHDLGRLVFRTSR